MKVIIRIAITLIIVRILNTIGLSPQNWFLNWMLVLLVYVVVGLIMGFMPIYVKIKNNDFLNIGDEGYLNSNTNKKNFSGGILIMSDPGMLKRILSARDFNDEAVTEVGNGVKVEILDRDMVNMVAQIEVLEGDQLGKIGWVLIQDVVKKY